MSWGILSRTKFYAMMNVLKCTKLKSVKEYGVNPLRFKPVATEVSRNFTFDLNENRIGPLKSLVHTVCAETLAKTGLCCIN